MTQQEIVQRNQRNAKIYEQMQQRKRDTLTSGNCQYEWDSESNVCVSVTSVDLDCSENHDDFYSDCEVEIDYTVQSDYVGDSSISATVECEADISYRSNYHSSEQSKDDDDTYSHYIYDGMGTSGTIDIDFSFSSYHEVYELSLDSAECEVTSAMLF